MKKMRALVFLLLAITCTTHAQIGDNLDKPGVVQTPIVPKELIPPSPALTPGEALKTFQFAEPGYRIELVASEPMIQEPVSAHFDHEGRLWVVEMRGYMPDLDGNNEDAPVGRVSILEDTDRDGKMDKSTVFLDRLVLPRAVMPVAGGALIGAPPKLWYCRDTNGDNRADEQIEIASDYGVQVDPERPHLANPERAPNSPMWALDNWIYSTAYLTRYRYVGGEWKKSLTTFRGQFGLSEDDAGHLFYGNNSDQLRGDIIPAEYLTRNPHLSGASGVNVRIPDNQLVWPIRVTPGINRGYQPQMLRDGKLKAFTAACSQFIYRGDLFPEEFYNNAFVCEPSANFVRRNLMFETNGSLTARNAYEQKEFLASTDERFRPVALTSGPDGALYIVDLYRGVLQHRISLTTYLRKQSEERGLDKPLHLGRIYRVVPEGKKIPNAAPQFAKETPVQWVKSLSHPNNWYRATAQRLLVEKRDLSVLPELRKIITAGKDPLGQVRALWTLEGLGQVDLLTIETALRDKNPKVRAAAIRVSESLFAEEEKDELVAKLVSLTDDSAPEVQLQLALTLGNAKDTKAEAALAKLAKASSTNSFLPDAILSGLPGRELEMLETLATDSVPPANVKNFNRVLGGLAACIMTERKPQRVERLLEVIAASKSAGRQQVLLDGLLSTSAMTSKKPIKFSGEPKALASLQSSKEKTLQSRIEKLQPLFTWAGKPGAKPEPVVPSLSAEEQKRFQQGKELFAGSCAACHQAHGMGMDGLAPPLADSEWVLGSEERLARIVLKGLTGPIKVNGRGWYLDMPSMGMFDDEQIAAVLTYIRREWDNTGAPVKPETVKRIRAETANRAEAWSAAELEKIP